MDGLDGRRVEKYINNGLQNHRELIRKQKNYLQLQHMESIVSHISNY